MEKEEEEREVTPEARQDPLPDTPWTQAVQTDPADNTSLKQYCTYPPPSNWPDL